MLLVAADRVVVLELEVEVIEAAAIRAGFTLPAGLSILLGLRAV